MLYSWVLLLPRLGFDSHNTACPLDVRENNGGEARAVVDDGDGAPVLHQQMEIQGHCQKMWLIGLCQKMKLPAICQ